jgi:hypothetical protein
MTTNRLRYGYRVLAIPALLALITACAGPRGPVTVPEIEAAEYALAHALQAGASEYAPVEIGTAQERLLAAADAATTGDTRRAAQLADQARVTAELAMVRTENAQHQDVIAEIEARLASLRELAEMGIFP